MAGNTDVIKRGFEAFNSGDTDTVAATFRDDVVWDGTDAEELPVGGRHEGKDALMQAFGRIFESWESFSASADEFIEQDHTVVVLGHVEGRTKVGHDVKTPLVQVWRMQDGQAERVQALTDTLEVAKALEIV
jgi:uncharacterized protein